MNIKIKKIKNFINESTIEDTVEYELSNRETSFSRLKKHQGKNPICLGDENKISKTDLDNIKKTYPKSRIINREGYYYLKILESKMSDKIIEIYERISSLLSKNDSKEGKNLTQKQIDEMAQSVLNDEDYNLYKSNVDVINDMIEQEYLIKVYENKENEDDETEYNDDEETEYNDDEKNYIFSKNDDDYDEDELERGTDVQKEHEPTYNRIKKFHEITGEIPNKKDIYKSIAKDHMDEPEGVGELYYDEEEGLEQWEEELKKKWKEKQSKKQSEEESQEESQEETQEEAQEEAQEENLNIIKFSDFTLNENISNVDKYFEKIKDKYSEEDISKLINEKIDDYIPENWQKNYNDKYEAYSELGRGEAEDEVIKEIINKVVGDDIDIDDFEDLSNKIRKEYNIS